MSNKCNNFEININHFFLSYERVIALCFCLISFILNLILVISICVTKNKKISIVMRITGSILVVNFINILSYTFQWVLCKEKDSENNNYYIKLLFDKSNNLYVCNLQSFIMLSSALSQDYFVIFFFYIVNKKNIIKITYINLFSVLSIFVPILLSFIILLFEGFGINDNFCYIKKYENLENNAYIYYNKYFIFFIIVYTLRGINFGISIFLLIKIIKYISKEKSISYIINKLSILFIQLFKLFIILFYRIINIFWKDYPEIFEKIYIILSTIDGLLLPFAFAYSNEILQNILGCCHKSIKDNEDDKDIDDDSNPNNDNPTKDEEISMIKNNIYSNSINFDLSY